MWQGWFLLEQEPTTLYAVLQWNGGHGERLVFINHCIDSGINGVKHHIIFQTVAEELKLAFQHRLIGGRGIDVQGVDPAQHTKGGNHPHNTQAVVTMQM